MLRFPSSSPPGSGMDRVAPRDRTAPRAPGTAPWPLGDSTGPTGDPMRDCVRCGLCLEWCPTYRLHGDEAQGPRGRILILEALREGRLAPDREVVEPLESCLLCRSCETACPSGVRFGHLMETGRAVLWDDPATRRTVPLWRRLLERTVLSAITDPRRRRLVWRTARWLRSSGLHGHLSRSRLLREEAPWILSALSLLPDVTEPPFDPRAVESASPGVRGGDGRSRRAGAWRGGARAKGGAKEPAAGGRGVLVFAGCVTPWAFPAVSRAVHNVLERAGRRPGYPAGQTCCGALHIHHGDPEAARRFARRNILAFERDPKAEIVAEAAGCGAALKSYGALLTGDPLYAGRAREFAARVKDFSEAVAGGALPPGGPTGVRAVFQDACHLYHVQGLREEPARLLQRAGVEVVTAGEREICCGSAGIANLLQPENGDALGRRKAEVLAAAGADLVVTSNPGCMLQLARHMAPHGVPVRHLAEVLDGLDSSEDTGAVRPRRAS